MPKTSRTTPNIYSGDVRLPPSPLPAAIERYTPTRPVVHTGAAVLLGVLVVAVLCALVGCAGTVIGRTRAEQTASAVRIDRVCVEAHGRHVAISSGSGAVVGSDAVVTAYHVVDPRPCSGGGRAPTLRVMMPDGSVAYGEVDWTDPVHDLARLLVPGVEPIGRVVVGHVAVASVVCADVAMPARERVCGRVTGRAPWLWVNGTLDVALSIPIHLGNSGSVLYDGEGRAVAVVTNLVRCIGDPSTSCGGLASSIASRLP